MKKLIFDVNTTDLTVSSGGNFVTAFQSNVNGDSILFAAHFTEILTSGSPTDLDLTDPGTPLALRITIRSARDTASRLWGFQDVYNQGNYTAGEVLTEGRVTWLVNFGFMSYNITAVSTGSSTFTIAGDFATQIAANDFFTVSGSTGNDGDYTVNGDPVYAAGPDTTTITVTETIADATVDGTIDHSALDNELDDSNSEDPSISGFAEVSLLDSNTIPQTLMQQGMQFFDELDDGANSVSAGAQPFYLTATEIAAIYIPGPGVVADNAMVVFDGTTGLVIQEPNADIDALTQKIVNLLDPTNPQDAATRAYVLAEIAAGGGDVTGPASATNNGLVRYDGTTGKIIKDSSTWILAGTGAMIQTNNTNATNLILNMNAAQTANPFQIRDSAGNRIYDFDESGKLDIGYNTKTTRNDISMFYDTSTGNSEMNAIKSFWNGTEVSKIIFLTGIDTVNKDDGQIHFQVRESGAVLKTSLLLHEDGMIKMGDDSAPVAQLHIESQTTTTETLRLEMDASQTASPFKIVNSGGTAIWEVDETGTLVVGTAGGGGGGGGGGSTTAYTGTVIDRQTLAATASSITFSSIDQTYDYVEIIARIRTDTVIALDGMNITLNSDTTDANYWRQRSYGFNNSNNSSESAFRNITNVVGGSGSSNSFASIKIEFPDYASTTRLKNVISYQNMTDTVASSGLSGVQSYTRNNVSATTQIDLDPTGAGDFAIGCEFVLIGYKETAVGGNAWVTIKKTAAYTAVNFDEIMADTAATAAFTVTLPATPSNGNRVRIQDSAANFGTDNLTVGRNGNTIRGAASDLVLSVNDEWVEFVWNDDDSTWEYRK